MELKGREIFSQGRWNDIDFSDDDIDAIVSSFDALDLSGKIPLKLSHEGPDERFDPASKIALGWVTRVYRDGKKLLADMDIPDRVAHLVRENFLKFVSVELLKDVQAGTRVIPWVLDAVALLGADQPAVGILKDLTSLTMARRTDLQFRARVAFRRDSDQSGDRKTMAEDAAVKAMQDQIAKLQSELDKQKEIASQAEVFKRRAEDVEARSKQERVAAHFAKIKDKFETAINAKRILPKVRERFFKRFDVEEGNEGFLKIGLDTVDEYISENPNPMAPRNPASFSAGGDTIPAGALADVETGVKAREIARSNGDKPTDAEALPKAAVSLFRRDPDLAKRWRNLPSDLEDVA